jgi:hypothetical protein
MLHGNRTESNCDLSRQYRDYRCSVAQRAQQV